MSEGQAGILINLGTRGTKLHKGTQGVMELKYKAGLKLAKEISPEHIENPGVKERKKENEKERHKERREK